jgi:hypothetical protein
VIAAAIRDRTGPRGPTDAERSEAPRKYCYLTLT